MLAFLWLCPPPAEAVWHLVAPCPGDAPRTSAPFLAGEEMGGAACRWRAPLAHPHAQPECNSTSAPGPEQDVAATQVGEELPTRLHDLFRARVSQLGGDARQRLKTSRGGVFFQQSARGPDARSVIAR
jgi:hypothetical protein